MSRKTVTKYALLIVVVCFAAMVIFGFVDWMSKYLLYLKERAILHDMIGTGGYYELQKKSVSYLQGTATRQLHEVRENSLYFAIVISAIAWFWRTTKDSQN